MVANSSSRSNMRNSREVGRLPSGGNDDTAAPASMVTSRPGASTLAVTNVCGSCSSSTHRINLARCPVEISILGSRRALRTDASLDDDNCCVEVPPAHPVQCDYQDQ